ncbi:small polypeptide DEVIL 22-like [Primulina eburnea]|uniref:small polypeptide DEVIL 22-like n=1 Tax=Primulina eburnea TaxID=1245227 RepID=UPI003C6C2881
MADQLKQKIKNKISNPRKSKSNHNFTRKCASLVREQRARIYILRRCATMLLCWYIQGDE